MPEIPKEAVQAAAEAIERELMSGRDYSMAADSDEALARVALEAAAPGIAAQARAEAMRDVASLGEKGLVVVSAEDLRTYLDRGNDLKAEVDALNRLRAALPERNDHA